MSPALTTTSAPFASAPAAGFFGRVVAGLAKIRRVSSNRRRVKALLDLDDHLLMDLGLTRRDIDAALATPWDEDASTILERRTRRA
ncbi:DUF1127 domain-containing protein [Prosthecomicrobium sp. N25]|uniref:DUF1127 domain-containing protein n=1 Tax=Prosthecomicrobium sp. N25 TaxID=3129254 RepID=UPI003077D2F5